MEVKLEVKMDITPPTTFTFLPFYFFTFLFFYFFTLFTLLPFQAIVQHEVLNFLL